MTRFVLATLFLLLGADNPQPATRPAVGVTAVVAQASVGQTPTTIIVKGDDPYGLPNTEIVSPTKPVKRGHNIIIKVKPIETKPSGLVQTSYIWLISPKVDDLFPYPDNTQAAFGSGDTSDPNHYDITLIANYLFVDADGKNPVLKTTAAYAAVDVAGPVKPTPTPTPDNPDVPTPTPGPLPQGKYGLAPFMYAQAKVLPPDQAALVAGTLRGLSAQIAAGGFQSKAQLANTTANNCSAALGSRIDAWIPALDALTKKMDSLGIVKLPDCKVAYDEVATGLEAVK